MLIHNRFTLAARLAHPFINMRPKLRAVFHAVLLSSIAPPLAAAPELRFIPATPENTTLADGSPLNLKEGEGAWKWLPDEGNHGVFESYGDPKRNAPPLVLRVNDLKAGADYEVFGYFWAHGFGEPKNGAGSDKEPHHWPARFGLGLASLTTYGGRFSPRIPWIISPGAKTSASLGVSATLEESSPLGFDGAPLTAASCDLRLIRALVGISRSDAAGTLPVFMDDFPDSIHCGRTRIDGVALRPAPAGSKPSAGAGDSKALHFALRAGDRLSVERELAAGADVNALDAQGNAPLFHPACVGDQQSVRLLLAKGADPNRKEQSILALTAAATVGDAAMVRLLIEAGAEVPPGMVNEVPRVNQVIDASHLHPAIAAIRAGSLSTLKVLLEKRPDLDLESLGPPRVPGTGGRPTSMCLIEDAMAMGHDELAAFLIDRGCTFRNEIFRSDSDQPHSVLLVRSITEGESLSRSRAAIFRRGLPLVFPVDSKSLGQEVMPWDALSAAVSVGNRDLAAELLPKADQMDQQYGECLTALARWAGDPIILGMVHDAFPKVDTRMESLKSQEVKTHDEAELRLLLPRVVPSQNQKKNDPQDWTLAVIPSPEVEGQAAFIEVTASSGSGWRVVDRKEVKEALSEARFQNPWANGEHRLAELGDRVAADLLVLVSQLNGPKIHLLRFEAVDVATGLPVFREHIERETFKPETAVEPLLARIRAAFARARSGELPKAVTMLPFTAASDLPNATSLARLFKAAIYAEVDATPGLLALVKDQSQVIADEQKLGGHDGLWAAAFTLEGGVAKMAEGQVALTLRLLPLSGGKEGAIDVTESGKPNEIPELASRAWMKLAGSNLLAVDRSTTRRPDASQSAAEAARLLREAEWLVNCRLPTEALPLFERAGLLGANPQQLVSWHLNALAQNIPMFDGRISLSQPKFAIKTHPPSLSYQKKTCQSLEAARAMLDQASYYLENHGAASLKWVTSDNRKDEWGDFLNAVTILSYIRATIPKVLPAGTSPESVRLFGEDLDRFTAEYFRLRARMDQSTVAYPLSYLFRNGPGSAAMLRRNPELLKGWSTVFLMSRSTNWPFGEYRSGVSEWYGMTRLLAETVERRLEEYTGGFIQFRKAELAYVLATDDLKSVAAREYMMMVAGLGRQDRSSLAAWISNQYLQRHLPLELQDVGFHQVPIHDEATIAALMHEPKGNLDFIRYPGYSNVMSLISLETQSVPEADYRLKISSPSGKYYQRAKELSKEQDGWAKVERLLGGALEWERIYGRPLYDELSASLSRLYQPARDNSKDSLNARLLADLRQVDNFLPGVFRLPIIDRSRRGRMWLYYQPFEAEPLMDKTENYTLPVPHRRQPWLLGIDCNEGKLSPLVNLARAPGLGPDEKVVNSTGGYWQEHGFIAQTNDMILTQVKWRIKKGDQNPAAQATVLVRKSDGQMIPLDKPVLIGSPIDVVNSRVRSSGVCSIGDEFFGMQQVGNPDITYTSPKKIPFEVVRIGPFGNVSPVTVHGRRPELSPFDPADRSPKMIFPDRNRLLVLHDSDFNGRYNPADGTWEMDQSARAKRYATMRNLTESDFRSHVFPHHILQKGAMDKQWIIDCKRTSPGMLYLEGAGESGRIKVELELPDHFVSQPIYGDPVYSKGNFGTLTGYGTYESRIKGDHYHLVVLNQTDTDLILALQIGPGLKWYPGARTGLFLPVLWALPKSELLRLAGE